MKKAFTLLELLIVIVIIGVLGTLGITNYMTAKEKALDKEAIANLKLIQSAQKIYRMESSSGNYFPEGPLWWVATNIAQINTNLKLLLPAGTNRNWNYCVVGLGIGCATATRNGSDNRQWRLNIDQEEPTSGKCAICP
jgi:prepilin-type N-terminal cleavage/methylation domain-containing protein